MLAESFMEFFSTIAPGLGRVWETWLRWCNRITVCFSVEEIPTLIGPRALGPSVRHFLWLSEGTDWFDALAIISE